MSGDENMADVLIPSLFITHSDGRHLLRLTKEEPVTILMTWLTPEDMKRHNVKSILGNTESSTNTESILGNTESILGNTESSSTCEEGKDCDKNEKEETPILSPPEKLP